MRSTLILTLILLVSAWAVAQQDATSPSAPAGQSQTQSQTQPGSPSGQATSPNASSSNAPMGGGEVVEGCLGGSNPNYTVTDKAGTTYTLVIPQGTDSSVLAKHIGESVQVQGSTDNSASSANSSAAGSSTSSSASSGGKVIRVARIGRGTSSCPGSGAGGASATKPPSK